MSSSESAALQRILERERIARKMAEKLLEAKSRELFETNKQLKALADNLELRVKERTLELEEARIAAEAGAEAKSIFLANMSHEIRTPLNGIVGMNHLLLEERLSSKQLHYAQAVQDSAELLLGILNDILDFSKVEAGKLEIEVVEFSILDVIDGVFELLQVKASNKNIDFNVIHDPKLPDRLKGDPSRLQQVLLNLVDNAIKFTPEGSVCFRVSCLHSEGEHCQVQFSIEDTGIGMSEANLEKLFQPFSQAEPSIGRRFGGSGLGLVIANELAKLMGGEIKVSSRQNEGSIFTVTLPFSVPDGGRREKRLLADKKIACMVTAVSPQRESLVSMIQTAGISTVATIPLSEVRKAKEASAQDIPTLWIISCDGLEDSELQQLPSLLKEYRRTLHPLVFVRSLMINAETSFDAIETLPLPINRKALTRRISALLEIKNKTDRGLQSWANALQDLHLDRLHILIAEDNIINQIVCREMLLKLGAKVDIAANGYEVIQMLEMIPYDLILMDIRMPEMGGVEACKQIRKKGLDIPIVALTANALKGDKERFLEAGMNDYLSKPLIPGELIKMMLRIFSQDKDTTPTHDQEARLSEAKMVLDFEALVQTLRGNESMAMEVIQEFCKQCTVLEDSGFTALQNKDWSAASSVFHRWSGSAHAIKAQNLALAAGDIEVVLKMHPVVPEELEDAKQRFLEALQSFKAHTIKQGWQGE